SGFPKVLGCVDGTQIKIATPNKNENDFVNRKGVHALNVQMICDPKFRITSLCANWPRSVHDSRIWRQCELNNQFQNGIHNGLLLGDSGYPCLTYLMTPFLNPTNRHEENFNTSLCRTRVLIEQTFGILKRRFALLHYGIRSSPQQAVIYITACVILHNLGIGRGGFTKCL
ncbi:putative nuclease HARBI1, partial [Patella vulgata]|uniref:putative nuclease HARBI1 n=1 Tax=Patella vulgata TaxID=6465 RepID=UPI0024A91734